MTEDKIEQMVEALTDVADARLMGNKITQAEYDLRMKQIAGWAEKQYAHAAKAYRYPAQDEYSSRGE